ncbi:MAG: FliO/MopB family protein, partial [Phyllobacteriaceae bacterium]|nr:FliO/MopB family protein [Phyllobacteriaceae bacterium]
MLFALLLVVLLILAVTWLFRRLFGTTFVRGRSTRLSVIDSAPVDPHRRLLLVRRDDVEHLVMVGGPNDLLVESRILRAAPVVAGRATAHPQPVPPRAAPRPAVPEPEPAAVEPPPA